ncbi:PAS domain S-box-containing protein [Formivibrio citricus]|uniref:histidine kinase n=1 Tax=Formivibrio citricus TaxID=83765 RepID=A0A1I4Y6D0_9NEIS|nr:ATP-binding protein [Formivibrio citricus]SFN33642.1 PAS domain S-box-containing protein [Formivibrio citricus]
MQATDNKGIESLQKQSQIILDSISEGIYGLDENCCVTYINRAAQFLLGWTPEEVIGKPAHPLFHHSREDGSACPFEECPISWVETGGSVFNIEDRIWRKDGTSFAVEISVVKLAETGAETRTVVLFRDITERKESQNALMKSYQELAALNARLETAHNQLLQAERLASVGQLAAGMAHEINNPIGFIQSNVGSLERYINAILSLLDNYEELERDGAFNPMNIGKLADLKKAMDYLYLREDMGDLLQETRNGIQRVRKIVQDLRNFSCEESLGEWGWTDLRANLDSALNLLQKEIGSKCTIRREYSSLPDVYCQAAEINHVFMNILLNATQAIEEKGEIVIRTRADENRVCIEISDTGKGIPPEHLQRIFDPFFTTRPVGKGTGLGLSTAYGIVQKHHGKIDVRSTPGRGSTFYITLPINADTAG